MKRKIIFAVFLVLLIGWMSVIFGFSANDAETSTDQSNMVTELLLKIFVPGFEQMNDNEQQALITRYDGFVRKLAHFASYAILAFLMYFTVGSIKYVPQKMYKPAIISLPTCVLFAISDEIHQTFVDGRAAQLSDILIDSGGIFCGEVAAIAVTVAIEKLLFSKYMKRAQ